MKRVDLHAEIYGLSRLLALDFADSEDGVLDTPNDRHKQGRFYCGV